MAFCVQMLVDLGHDVYQDEFERGFLQTATEAYKVGAIGHRQSGTDLSPGMAGRGTCHC